MSRLLWKQFGDYIIDLENIDIDLDLIKDQIVELREHFTADGFSSLLLSTSLGNLFNLYQDFRSKDNGPMFRFWTNYLEMVEVLLAFIRASRTGNWELHVLCFCKMLTWLFAYDHVNYARYGTHYYVTMKELQHTHPSINESLREGYFGEQRSITNSFGKIPEDQTIEETINRQSKIPGGIVGKSTNPEAVNQWVETTVDRSQITENIRQMAGVGVTESSWIHKEGTPSRMKRDENDIRKVTGVISSMLDPFVQSEDLTSISTGINASAETSSDLFRAQKEGDKKLQDFIKQRIMSEEVPYFDAIKKNKLKTFSTDTKKKPLELVTKMCL